MASSVLLFVDDEKEILEIIDDTFQESFVKTFCVSSGNEAKKILDNRSIDLIICDLMLPDVSGLDVLEYFKTNSPHTYRILMTGYLDEEKELIARKQKLIQDTIPKPWDVFQLQQKIEELLQRNHH